MVFHLLGVHFDAFGQDDKGRDAYALWLGERSGSHASYIASNLFWACFLLLLRMLCPYLVSLNLMMQCGLSNIGSFCDV